MGRFCLAVAALHIGQNAFKWVAAGARLAAIIYVVKINDFFAIVEQISAVDTTGVVPMAHPLDAMHNSPEIALRLRADAVSETNQREANQRSAPAVERGLFLVPKVEPFWRHRSVRRGQSLKN